MSHLLWKYWAEDDLARFHRLLSNSSQNAQQTPKGHAGGNVQTHSYGSLVGSPGGFGTSPKAVMKNRKVSGQAGNSSGTRGANPVLSRADINSRDHAGLTILHRAASSTSTNAISFALALIVHPAVDLYIQDPENGWTALHRALYFGNATIARAIIDRDRRDPRAGFSVIKIKDREGNSPFDVYNATIARRALPHGVEDEGFHDNSEDEDDSVQGEPMEPAHAENLSVNGDEMFFWGSSKNHTLGFGDGDDRQHPEKLTLKRPDHLLFRFYREYLESMQSFGDHPQSHISKPFPKNLGELPALILNRPIIVRDITLSKLHSAILTTDPEANLYICGFGPGGRLGTGDEVTRFTYTCIEDGGLTGKKVMTVALGRNHTLAVSSDGEIFSWGNNAYGQLGYSLPRPTMKDEEPFCSTPRQLFGPLKRETIIGVAASAVHSVAYTSTSLFTWGKNEGQLGLMDSDSRSLDIQATPRRVAASLFRAPILSVSAINGATICLLANYTVCVFTNYGYNNVKFPLHEGFSNYHLRKSRFTTYDGSSNHISSITAGGDTIAAISSRGDLFTMNVRKVDSNPVSTSTTNPSKIKGALSQPERIWSLRKGNWDGIKSVGISENGSVIVCTQAGAVWRRVKRPKIKDTYTAAGDFNRKDFKFQRVPGLTKVAAVRSTPFGVYAAIRKDCDVTKNQILVEDQNLWQDVGPLLSLKNLKASESPQEDASESPRFWTPVLPKDVLDLFDPVKRAVLVSHNIEADVSDHLRGMELQSHDVHLCTTTSDVSIPVHGFMLASRSSILKSALTKFHLTGSHTLPNVFDIEAGESKTSVRLIFHGLDFITLVNLAVYMYTDTVIDVWHFTRQFPKMAFRYRQVRVELMKTAGYLKISKLESAVRLMIEAEPRMDVDMAIAIQDAAYFEDGDTIIELDGSEVLAHSSLLCQRCPFFQGLFNGRSGGEWLAGRWLEDSKTVRIDLKHIAPETFELVLQYLYTDTGTELFDEVVSPDIDEFSELVMDVMGVANELMLDRLSQICQEVIGRFVNTRNVSQLLNVMAPCSVAEFKNAALEYVCLQLESMLENHLIDDLDEDLLLELDEVVRANQLNCLPFAKSGRFELELLERHPGLAGEIDEERQRRVRDMTFRANLKDDDSRLSTSFRYRVGSLDDLLSASPSHDKARRKSKADRNAPFSPSIRPKDFTVDLMFDMEDDDPLAPGSPSPERKTTPDPASPPVVSLVPKARWDDIGPEIGLDDRPSSIPSSNPKNPTGLGLHNGADPASSGTITRMWSSPAMPSSKLDMREIMAQASSSRTSNLSISLSAQRAKDDNANPEALNRVSAPKLSQKERKKQQQQTLQRSIVQPQDSLGRNDITSSSPWQIASTGPKLSLKDVLNEPSSSPSSAPPKPAVSPIPMKPLTPRRTASPDTRFSGQSRNNSNSNIVKANQSPAGPSRSFNQQAQLKSSPLVPHSKSYTASATKAEPSIQLSMADIIGQQRREQEVIKEAVAKRSLQEIQEEQAFQEWWDQESKRAQEEEASKSKPPVWSGRGGKPGSGRGKGGRGRSGRGRGEGSRGGTRGRGQDKDALTR
ncbi:BTB POZ domain-containing 1 [Hyphodiscus hymeniophilus]|uniref:BTB POZ domain-containing 1 n=1 Tax=Hyphodiscus hymeniophilus TaxID=353542 RepID=A0A9P7AZ27_9HELO|nr:BTB POZ domain-containing 1 [Hyphodiscus hymeniophilus]